MTKSASYNDTQRGGDQLAEVEARQMIAQSLGVSTEANQIFPKGPTLAQCCGTSRLWGTDLALAFSADSVTVDLPLSELQRIIVLGRAFLVISDYAIDHAPNQESVFAAARTTERIRTDIVSKCQKLGFDSGALDCELQTFGSRLSTLCFDNPAHTPTSISQRTKLWSRYFFPYSFCNQHVTEELRLRRLEFLEAYFELCLILDDFADIEDDANNSHWDNVFLAGKDDLERSRFIQKKYMIAPSMIAFSRKILWGPASASSAKNPVLAGYIDQGRKWVVDLEATFQTASIAPELVRNDEIQSFSTLSALSRDDIGQDHATQLMKRLRPEYLQTDDIPEFELS